MVLCGFASPTVISLESIASGTLYADPSLFVIVLTPGNYTSVTFGFAYVDAAGGVDPTPTTYTVYWGDPLPVRLARFDVLPEGESVGLTWSTSSEANSMGFDIERSADASNWVKVGYVASQSTNSSGLLRYYFTDPRPARGINYYRLRMVDLDGTFDYSEIRSIELEGVGLMLYPNPVVNGTLTIDLPETSAVSVKVYNAVGREVLQGGSIAGRTLDVSRLPSGVYVIRVIPHGGITRTKTLVVK